MSNGEGYLLCVELFESDYSEEDISEFVMRKFLRNIHNNYSFAINKMNNTVVEDTIPVIEDTSVEENTIHISIDKPVVEDKPKKVSKKSEDEINDDDMESYLNHFKPKTNYTNEQRISIFKSEFNTQLSDVKSRILLISILRYFLLVLAERKRENIN
jgi:hypothetical protein